MNEARQFYNKLREFSSGKEIPYDSLRKGYEIEKLVHVLMKEIVSPLTQKTKVRIGKSEFDGEVRIGNKIMLYQLFAGNLSKFRYLSLMDLLKVTYFPYKTYVLIIAQSFSNDDKIMIKDLIDRKVTDKVAISFIDYETLISLHEFSSAIPMKYKENNMKVIKRLFLEYLLSLDSVINRKSFNKALDTAMSRLPFEIRAFAAHEAGSLDIEKMTDRRLRTLEDKVDKILLEIQNLRSELKPKSMGAVSMVENEGEEEIHEIDLEKIEGEGSFSCPKCGATIDPDDETEEAYEITEVELRNDKLSALTLTCSNCGTTIRLVGFIDAASFSSKDKITRIPSSSQDRIGKKSIQAYLRSMR